MPRDLDTVRESLPIPLSIVRQNHLARVYVFFQLIKIRRADNITRHKRLHILQKPATFGQ